MLFLADKIKSTEKAAFQAEVIQMGDDLGFDPNWLMIVMFLESGLNPQAINNTTGASGLIQFMPNTAKNLGTSVEELRQMSAVDQLEYVRDYLSAYKGKFNTLADLYLTVFYPAAVGKSNDYVLGSSSTNAAKIAAQNKIFDTNKDGIITKGEIVDYMNNYAKRLGFIEKAKKYSFIPAILLLVVFISKI